MSSAVGFGSSGGMTSASRIISATSSAVMSSSPALRRMLMNRSIISFESFRIGAVKWFQDRFFQSANVLSLWQQSVGHHKNRVEQLVVSQRFVPVVTPCDKFADQVLDSYLRGFVLPFQRFFEVRVDDAGKLFAIRRFDIQAQAATQERRWKIAFTVACQDDDGKGRAANFTLIDFDLVVALKLAHLRRLLFGGNSRQFGDFELAFF